MTSADPIAVALPDDAMRLLTWGLHQWGGPAYCTDAMAVGMGFADAEHMLVEVDSLRDTLSATSALTPADWTRALLAVEVVFASDVVGAASE